MSRGHCERGAVTFEASWIRGTRHRRGRRETKVAAAAVEVAGVQGDKGGEEQVQFM
jgi:hypothetical protein